MISVESLRYAKRGLGPLDLSIEDGEFIWLCGASGSGKSTLCDLLCGHLEASEGCVEPESGTAVGYLAQDFENQLLGATIGQELEFSRRASGGAPEPVGVARILKRFKGREGTDPRELSAGEQQLLLVACLMLARSRLLVLDETLSRLSLPEMAMVCDCLKELVRTGVSVVLVSHQLRAVLYAERVIVMGDGLVLYDGASSELSLELLKQAHIWTGVSGSKLPWRGLQKASEAQNFHWSLHGEGGELGKGEALVLVGASGSGKSRLLASMSGLAPMPGVKTSHDLDFAYLRERAHSALWRKTVELELEASHTKGGGVEPSWVEGRLGQMIPAEWLAKNPRSLSQGQMRYLLVVCLTLQRPELLLLDEPFSGLDSQLRDWASEMLVNYLEAGGRLIMSSHEPDEIVLWGESIAVLQDSRAVWLGQRSDFRWQSWSGFLWSPMAMEPALSKWLGG